MSQPHAAYPVPSGKTARRLDWVFLPPHLRSWIERQCGSPVVKAISQDAGFTPGFASVLICEDGSRHFVKAASVKAQQLFADSYREEARKLKELPASAPAPRLKAVLDDDWVALVIEYVAGRVPQRPWLQGDLDRALDALEVVADTMTPPPMPLESALVEFEPMASRWAGLLTSAPQLPHASEAAALASRYREIVPGNTLVHTDIRDDNILIDGDGQVWFCDWNWPVTGAAWLDTLLTLIGPRGDGLDVEAIIATRRLIKDVPAESIDIVLALLVGYFVTSAEEPVPHTSPHIREHQRWQGEVCWAWLCERRGWA